MCLILQNKYAKAKIATEDIKVFKYVHLDLKRNTWRPLYYDSKEFPLNKRFKAKGTYPECENDYTITFGEGVFHTCGDLNSLIRRKDDTDYDTYIVVAVIPKDTKYFASKTMFDICSEELIVTDIIIAGDGDSLPEVSKEMLKKAKVEKVEVKGKTYIQVEDDTHKVCISLRNKGDFDWITAMEKANKDGEKLPSLEDFEIIQKYRHQIDPLLEELNGDNLDRAFWSCAEFYSGTAWFYYGYGGTFYAYVKYLSYTCRPVLAL